MCNQLWNACLPTVAVVTATPLTKREFVYINILFLLLLLLWSLCWMFSVRKKKYFAFLLVSSECIYTKPYMSNIAIAKPLILCHRFHYYRSYMNGKLAANDAKKTATEKIIWTFRDVRIHFNYIYWYCFCISDCVATWNRSAGVQFLRLGLSLYDQKVNCLRIFFQQIFCYWF